jgi:peptide-methionine (S)-S-oxide reductase
MSSLLRPNREPARMRLPVTSAAVLVLLGLAAAFSWPARTAENAISLPAPAVDTPAAAQEASETAVLAGGCFWGVQAVFQHVKGVNQVLSGYSGGAKDTAQYETVSTGTTGHAESVQIKFDPRQISYGRILQIYFSVAHNPTELNRQGPDTGTQYRSAIFYADATQQKIAQAYIAQLDKAHAFKEPIVTKLTQLTAFYPAERYHQDYATLHPDNPYIYYNDLPKVENLKRLFPDLYLDQPVLVRSASRF